MLCWPSRKRSLSGEPRVIAPSRPSYFRDKVNLVFTPHFCLGGERQDDTLMLLSKMSIPFFWSLLNSECQDKLGRDCGSKGKCSQF